MNKKACSACISNAYSRSKEGMFTLVPVFECEVCKEYKISLEKNYIPDIPSDLEAIQAKFPPKTCSAEGTKHDNGKAQLSLLTRESLEAEARAFAYGAQKYDKNNYKKGMAWSRVIDAALRHLTAFNAGESIDPESKLSHLCHAKACLGMLVYYYENKIGTDDR